MATDFWSPIKLSLEVACISGLIVLVFGVLVARFMAQTDFKGKTIVETAILLPLVLSPSVIGFLLIFAFGKNSPFGQVIEWFFNKPVMFTWWAAVIASSVVALPLMYQSAKTGFESVDKDIEEAALVDGAGHWLAFLYVTIPLSFKAIISGGILSFARALGEFGATLMFAGNIPGKTQTIPTAIYVAIESGNMKMAWLWVGCTILISIAMLMAVKLVKP
ncbi:molybdate ABC transporter permease subunit [Lederbergia citrea]|uniref:molybdate ABC transporter permease subunit n=1 Tax=Lederbergia citrea TaxID=2833581 RepID=UPI001BCA173C|nr:molybdate ABC transporter permease subunit [Lederbergia citrea]MBS4178920.1 molybdate ABC transporter permease subunit [Lederbergia citrea]MBS4205601.1 molybdate ABC transporter permease subunit [Lederbergia citrea]